MESTQKDECWGIRLAHMGTGFRSGLALSTNAREENSEHGTWDTYLICEYNKTFITTRYSRSSARLFHEGTVNTIEKFLLNGSIFKTPLLVSHEDLVIKTLASWWLSGWI